MQYLDQLIEGYRRFRGNDWARERERWSELSEGQSPQVMILSCADSRVDPAQIFDARPGESRGFCAFSAGTGALAGFTAIFKVSIDAIGGWHLDGESYGPAPSPGSS